MWKKKVEKVVTKVSPRLYDPFSSWSNLYQPHPSKLIPSIRSFQYVYNPLIARFSRHNLKLFPDAVIRSPTFFNYRPRYLPSGPRSLKPNFILRLMDRRISRTWFSRFRRLVRTQVIIKRFAFFAYNWWRLFQRLDTFAEQNGTFIFAAFTLVEISRHIYNAEFTIVATLN